MQTMQQHLLHISQTNLQQLENGEVFEILVETECIKMERILSKGHTSDWFIQDRDEHVTLLQGQASLLLVHTDNVEQVVHLKAGDALVIPKQLKHRVISTTADPICIWLAVHYK